MGKHADIFLDKSTHADLKVLEEIFRLLIERGRAVRAARKAASDGDAPAIHPGVSSEALDLTDKANGVKDDV